MTETPSDGHRFQAEAAPGWLIAQLQIAGTKFLREAKPQDRLKRVSFETIDEGAVVAIDLQTTNLNSLVEHDGR